VLYIYTLAENSEAYFLDMVTSGYIDPLEATLNLLDRVKGTGENYKRDYLKRVRLIELPDYVEPPKFLFPKEANN
jgi:hypothetical protein